MSTRKLLFVCLGNICRSPTAEAVMVKKISELKLSAICDSAGTSGFHDGEFSDPRSIHHGKKRGYALTSISRKIRQTDFTEFDFIFAMDKSNQENIEALAINSDLLKKVFLITEFSEIYRHRFPEGVPDPYYGTDQDFDLVIDILEDSCDGIAQKLLS